jgi:hypothetical protein
VVEQVLGLADQFSDPNLVATVFAPTNAAFTTLLAELGLSATDALTQYRDTLNTVRPLSLS